MEIQTVQATAYFAPTARRRFFTKKGAAQAEARAMMSRKYPAEKAEYDEYGRQYNRAWHWVDDDRLIRVCERLQKRIYRQLLKAAPTTKE